MKSKKCIPPLCAPCKTLQSFYFAFAVQALQFLSKAHRCQVQAGGWEKEPALFKEVIKRAIDMGEGERTIQLLIFEPYSRKLVYSIL